MRGQIIQLKRDMNSARNQEEMTVSTRPPKKPSHVFFGDSFISGVRPKKKPASACVRIHLMTSLMFPWRSVCGALQH